MDKTAEHSCIKEATPSGDRPIFTYSNIISEHKMNQNLNFLKAPTVCHKPLTATSELVTMATANTPASIDLPHAQSRWEIRHR